MNLVYTTNQLGHIYDVGLTIRELALEYGDVLKVKAKVFPVVDHYLLYAGTNDRGEHWFIAALMGTGVTWLSESDLLQRAPDVYITKVRRCPGNDYDRNAAVSRAIDKIGTKYSLFGKNCESLANYSQYGVTFSSQVRNGAAAAMLGGSALALSSKSKGAQVVGGAVALTGLFALLYDLYYEY
jgi:hypothetical protein